MELLLATRNLHKVREIREMLKGIKQLDVRSLMDFPDYKAPEETGQTFEENATLKAEHAAKHLKKWALADDSGLVVPSLKGSLGIYSARYSGEDSTDAENRMKLLKELNEANDPERSAYFECCLVLVSPEGVKKVVSGIVEGRIAEEEKGRSGFGYDSLFIKNDYEKTFSELPERTKNLVSHRRKAIDKLINYLESLISRE